MYPRLFTIGPFTIYSFGLMMAIGFICASWLLSRELRRKGYDPNIGSTVTLFAVLFGIAGSKILYLIEEWPSFSRDPFGMAFSPGGLTWYGGFILATFAIWLYTRRRKINFLVVCDAAAPGLMIGYGIARIGCHLAGDGDYGFPTSLPWGAVYSKGTYPPSLAFQNFPDIVRQYGVDGKVPDTIPVHPTPLYEFLACAILFGVLWKLRTRMGVPGKLFALYLVFSGIERFLVEFIRLNPRLLFGLSEAQLIAILVVLAGGIAFRILSGKDEHRVPASS